MRKLHWLALLGAAGWLAMAPAARAQVRPYIGYAYPAGGQQGTTTQIRLGGQSMDDVSEVLVTGSGVTTKVVEYYRRLNNQELQLLQEQLRELKRATTAVASAMAPMMASETTMMMSGMDGDKTAAANKKEGTAQTLMAKIEKRTREFVQTPACASISSLVIAEITISSNAQPGEREIRLVTPRGVSNPLKFHVGQVTEFSRKPMLTATIQVLGKESLALRKRPPEEVEDRVTVPCTVNGQIASGEQNRYRFEARKGQRLVMTTKARQLIPYIADAVPGWFQPVLVLYDAKGKEVAYDDDFRFQPDPAILYEVPKDGEYVLAIYDAIYRGREDFVYRVTIGEMPFVTSSFPLGGRAGGPVKIKMKGWNLGTSELTVPAREAGPEIYSITTNKDGLVSNPLPLAVDTLPESFDQEPNNTPATAQKVTLPVIINGRINKPDDWDVFTFMGKSNDTVVVEVQARRLDSPLDSVIKLTDETGRVLAYNDDCEDLGAGVNTHHADSYFMAKLPADGAYYVHIGDTARKGGEEYGYRLRISAPQPDFELRVVPSSVSLRSNSTATVTVYAARKDGYAGPIKLALKDPPAGFTAAPVTLPATQTVGRLTFKSPATPIKEPVSLAIIGSAKMGENTISRQAVPAEDRMQAFLWRHLVPAAELKVLVFDPGYEPLPKRVARTRPPSASATNLLTNAMAAAKTTAPTNAALGTNITAGTNATLAAAAAKPKFTKQQITGRLRELKRLFEEGLLTDNFYDLKVEECEAAR